MANEKQEKQDSDHEEEPQMPDEDNIDPEKKEQYLNFKRSMDEFKGAQAGMTSESDNFKSQGNAYFSFGCYSQATIMYSEAIELQPHNAILYCNRAMAYLKQDMADLALADADRSLGIDPSVENIKAYWRKAQALLDLHRLDDAEAAASEGLELHGRNPHLNKVRRKARETGVIEKLMAGDWVGKLDNGIEQRLAFTKDGKMSMTVFGHSLTSTYELSVEGNPRSMVVRMEQQVIPGTPPAPPMVYIFEFHDVISTKKDDATNKDATLERDAELWLCHPTDGSQELPTKFEGSGLVKSRRVAAAKAEVAIESTEPMNVRCTLYMQAMIKLLPPLPPQLPEKPSDTQIKEEIETISRVSELKRVHGLEVHRMAVELAKDTSTAENEETRELAEQLRKRFVSRKLIGDDPKAKASVSPAPAPEVAAAAVVEAASPPSAACEVPDAAEDPSSNRPSASTNPAAALPAGVQLMPSRGDDAPQAAPDLLSRLAVCICCKSA